MLPILPPLSGAICHHTQCESRAPDVAPHPPPTDRSARAGDRGPKQVRATETNIAHREQELARLRDEAKAMRIAVDQKQLQLKAGEQKIKELKLKLNAAASNREYQILKEQIAADEMANSVLEDEIIEALEKLDQFQPKIAEAEAALAAAREKAARSARSSSGSSR